MKHTASVRYPASPDAVLRMFTDPDFHTRKLEAMGTPKYRVLDQQLRNDDFSIRIERKIPVQLPGMKKAAAETTVTYEEHWNTRTGRGSVSVHTQGMPLEMDCTTVVAGEGRSCVISYEWTVHSKVPLVGRKIEKMVVADMQRRFEDETRVSIDMLNGYHK